MAMTIWAHKIFIVALIGVALATLMEPAIEYIDKKSPLPKSIGVILTYLCLLFFIALCVAIVWFLASEQLSSLVENFPQKLSSAEEFLTKKLSGYISLKEINDSLSSGGYFKSLFKKAYKGLALGVGFFSYFFIALILAFYFSLNSHFYFDNVTRLVESSSANTAQSYLKRQAFVLRSWFKAQAIDMLCVAALTCLGLKIIGVTNWAAFGVLSGLFGLVPYVGIISIAFITCLSVLADQPSLVPWVIVVFFITQQIEGNLILPYFMKKHVSVPEALLVVFILLMGFWLGLLGVIIATPTLALIIETVNFFRDSDKKPIFKVENRT